MSHCTCISYLTYLIVKSIKFRNCKSYKTQTWPTWPSNFASHLDLSLQLLKPQKCNRDDPQVAMGQPFPHSSSLCVCVCMFVSQSISINFTLNTACASIVDRFKKDSETVCLCSLKCTWIPGKAKNENDRPANCIRIISTFTCLKYKLTRKQCTYVQ